MSVDVVEGGNIDIELQNRNRSRTSQHSILLFDRLMEDIVSGRVLPLRRLIARTVRGLRISPLVVEERRVLPLHRSVARMVRGLRISPLAVVEERRKVRLVLVLTVGHGVNTDTDFDTASVCDFGDVLFRFIAQTSARREQVSAEVPFYSANMDVKDATRRVRVHIEWDKAPIFLLW